MGFFVKACLSVCSGLAGLLFIREDVIADKASINQQKGFID